MEKRSIQNIKAFEIRDGDRTFFGFRQKWYKTGWQRMSGCGPTVVANIVYYYNSRKRTVSAGTPVQKDSIVEIMEEIWQHVKPTVRGLPEARLLHEGVLQYARAKRLRPKTAMLNIPQKGNKRPPFLDVIQFVDSALKEDSPVAFLNLNHGEEKQLESWHWVTIVSMEYSQDGDSAFIEILDEGYIKRIDLAKWYRTTSLGGGLVSFAFDDAMPVVV